MTWQDVASQAISAMQVIALAWIAVTMERSRRESSRQHARTVEAIAGNAAADDQPAPHH